MMKENCGSQDQIWASYGGFNFIKFNRKNVFEVQKLSIKKSKIDDLNKNLILLEDNVVFKSTQFKLLTNKVTFNQKNQTAESKLSSKFESDNTKVISEGFRITNNGDIILFDGKTTLILN